MTIIDERLNLIEVITLQHGMHADFEAGMCLLEATAWIAGEPWSDHPACVCPVLAAFGRSWNDSLNETDRNRILKPFVARLVGTRSTPEVQDARAFMAADWAVRTFTVAWLRKAGLDADADALAALPELSSVELCEAAMPTISEARASASAAWDAARAAAGAAAWDAARAAAWAAAWAAAGDALADTVTELQDSAADLLDRMIAVAS